jgi:hypothetical protein
VPVLIDIENLIREASETSLGEAFVTVDTGPCHRIGIGVKLEDGVIKEFFIEILLRLGKLGLVKDTKHLQSLFSFISYLDQRGYTVSLQEDSSISCERKLNSSQIESECLTILESDLFPPNC